MTDPLFLTIEKVLAIHADAIQRYGGSPALLNRGLLESAVAMPMQKFGGVLLHPDLASQAAAYLFYLTKNHAFEDGNKRVGAASAVVFLLMNQAKIELISNELVEITLRVANGTISKDELTEFLRLHISLPI